MAEAVLGLGGNVGARRAIFAAATQLLAALPGCTVLARSRLYETAPLGPPQPDYLNAALRVRWQRAPLELLAHCQRIEALLGRERKLRWGARTLDVDVLHWSEGPLRLPGLEVPHRELGVRNFALAPLLDVAPELAGSWGPALLRLGGLPPLAAPSWPTVEGARTSLWSGWTRDLAELASQLGALLSAHAAEPAPAAVALGTRVVSGASTLFERDGHCWLEDAIAAALDDGFAVRCAAITARTEERTTCILLGEQREAPCDRGWLDVAVESRPGGDQRLRVQRREAVAGPGFGGSATM